MPKYLLILVFHALLVEFSQSLIPLKTEKIQFNPSRRQSKSYETKNDLYTENIDVYSTDIGELLVGFNGTFVFTTRYKDESNLFDPETLEKETSFITHMTENDQPFLNTSCRLWKPEQTIMIICEANFMKKGSYSLQISKQSFVYRKEYQINVEFIGVFKFKMIDTYYPFLYSYKQDINITESQSLYELKFKFNSYYDEVLYIYGAGYDYTVLDNCEKKGKELICNISKEKIEEILISKNGHFLLGSLNDTHGIINFTYVYPININYENVQKEDIYIKLEKLVDQVTESGTPFAFETNVSKIPNFISDSISFIPECSSYFKKMTGKPLMLFIEYSSEDINYNISSITKFTFNNKHYKYNFIILPCKINKTIEIKDKGTNVILSYPEIIDFNLNDSLIIRYIFGEPSLAKEIKLNPDSESYLECNDLGKMKKCVVKESHFDWKENGIYNTYHKNHAGNFSIYYNAPLINVTSPERIYINYEDNKRTQYVGALGHLNLILDYNDSSIFNATDLEEKTTFETKINIDNEKSIDATCKLWKPIDEKLNMFCKLKEDLEYGNYTFIINNSSFYYNNKRFEIIQNPKNLSFFQFKENIPFLYSSKQDLYIIEKIETYDLKFKIGEYKKEKIFMKIDSHLIFLDECSVEGKELICKIKKDVLEAYAIANNQKLSVSYFMLHKEESFEMDLKFYTIHDIYIHTYLSKSDIYVGITKLLQNNIGINSYIVYETNVTNITNVYSKKFKLKLSNGKEMEFSFKKTEGISLVMIGLSSEEGNFSLGEMKDIKVLNDINIKYNFIIQSINNTEKFTILGKGSYIRFSTPKVLNFTSGEQITIDYAMISPECSTGIKLNPEANDLECTNVNNIYKKCKVPKSHFRKKDSGYYYTHHINNENKSIIFYESSPFKVILPENEIYVSINKTYNENNIKIGKEGYFAMVTDYSDKKKRIFDNYDNRYFFGNLKSKDSNVNYKINCIFWAPNDDNLRIICKFNGDTKNLPSNMFLEEVVVEFKNYVITIYNNDFLEFIGYNGYIPFLYSERQTIKIEDGTDSYYLKFKFDTYNKNKLYIYGTNNNYAILDKCDYLNSEEIICEITKGKIEETLTNNNEQFKIGAINDTVGIIPLEHILYITINYENVKKEDIFIQLTKIVGGITEVGTPFAYETNITEFPNFISQKFNKVFYIKKISGRPLMLFCDNPEETDKSPLNNDTKEMVINNTHYKYTFRIQPHEISGRVSIKGNGTNILLAYPEELNYASAEKFTILYIMNQPDLAKKLTLIPKSSDNLNCRDYYKMKLCDVPFSYFDGEKSGLYPTYHLNPEGNFDIYYDSPPISVYLPHETIEININKEDNKDTIIIGEKGMIYLKSEYNDKDKNIFDDATIEEKTGFNTIISCSDNKLNISCHLWKNTKGLIYIFCKIDKFLCKGKKEVKITQGNFFYDNRNIKIVPKLNNILIEQLEQPIPFLYAKSQTIKVEEGIDTYQLKFNIGYYHDEKLIITNGQDKYKFLDKCSIDKKELICTIEKSELEEISLNFHMLKAYLPLSSSPFFEFPMIDEFSINYTLPKSTIKVYIVKLDEEYYDINNYFAYETITKDNYTNLVTDNFTLEFKDENEKIINGDCFFKQINEDPLYLLCKAGDEVTKETNLSLSLSKTSVELKNIHIKYDFTLYPVDKVYKIFLKNKGSTGIFISQKILDFYKKDSITLDLIFLNPEHTENIRLVPEKIDNLNCVNLHTYGKRCNIHKNYFENNKSDDYYIYHLNHKNKYIKFYEFSPIRVLLPEKGEIPIRILKEYHKNGIKVGKEGIFAFVTDYNDTGRGIFDIITIYNITFNTNIKDTNNNKYKVNCTLWKANDEIIRIICKLNKIFEYPKQNIIFEQVQIDYIEYKIIINQIESIEATQYIYSIPFLYSDKIEISVTEENLAYYLDFSIESYNNELLYIYGDLLNYQTFDDCTPNHNIKILECRISLELIQGILTLNNSEFKIAALHDEIGIIPLDNILNITINYQKIEKEDISLQFTEVINPQPEIGTFFGFKTNYNGTAKTINSAPVINENCHFKKYADKPLMLLCVINNKGTIDFLIETEEKIYDNAHFKYNFRVKPLKEKTSFTTNNYGTSVKLINPEDLDFTKKDSFTLRYIMANPSLGKNIKLNNESPNLNCEDLEGMKKCTVHKDHFIGRKSGSYQTLYSTNNNAFIEYYESSSIKVTLPEEKIIEILVSDDENNQVIDIGDSGIVYFISNFKDENKIFNGDDIEEKTEFKGTITDKDLNNYETTCRLWKPTNEPIRIFCKLNRKITNKNIKLNSASFMYNGHKIGIISKMNFKMTIHQLDSKIPFIYAGTQTIEIEKTKNSYDIKLKVLEYNNEKLILLNIPKNGEEELNNMVLDSCNLIRKDLKCQLTREKIEQILGYSGQEYKLNYLDDKKGQLLSLTNTWNIKINYNSISKKDIIINITRILDNEIGTNNYIAYETNVTSIDKLISNKFKLNNILCLMKKDIEKPLLMICQIKSDMKIEKISKEIKLDNITIKYNLLILPREVEDNIKPAYESGNILFAFPMELDFLKDDDIIITYYVYNHDNYKDVRLNLDAAKDLLCDAVGNIVKCVVNKNHFSGKTTGYYYTYHKNQEIKYKISYELSPIRVILPDSGETMIRIKNIDDINPEKIGPKGAISFITDFEDLDNIFDISDIETQTANKIPFLGNNKNYTADCRLWKPKKEALRLICHFNENIDTQKLTLNKFNFNYKEKKYPSYPIMI